MASSQNAEGDQVPCRAVKQGGVTLYCELATGHEDWHKASVTEHREMTYFGSHHVYDLTEMVTWEPVDAAAEAVRHMLAGKARAGDG